MDISFNSVDSFSPVHILIPLSCMELARVTFSRCDAFTESWRVRHCGTFHRNSIGQANSLVREVIITVSGDLLLSLQMFLAGPVFAQVGITTLVIIFILIKVDLFGTLVVLDSTVTN